MSNPSMKQKSCREMLEAMTNRHMVNRIRLPSFLGGPNICHHNVRLHCYKYLCMNDYSQISVITMLGCFVTCTCA